MGSKVAAAFGSVALQSTLQKAALKRRKNGQLSEEETILVTLRTAESLKKALLGLGTTFIKGLSPDLLSILSRFKCKHPCLSMLFFGVTFVFFS